MAENDRAEPYIQITRYHNAHLEPSGAADFVMRVGGYDNGKGGRYLSKNFLVPASVLELISDQIAGLLAEIRHDQQADTNDRSCRDLVWPGSVDSEVGSGGQ